MKNQRFDSKVFIIMLIIVFILVCLFGCSDDIPERRFFTQGIHLQVSDLENHTFDMYENEKFIDKWRFDGDYIYNSKGKVLYTIQSNIFIIGNNYLKNNYSYKASGKENLITSIEFTKILLPQDSVQHNFKIIKL